MIDHNLHGMNYIKLSAVKYRTSHGQGYEFLFLKFVFLFFLNNYFDCMKIVKYLQ